MYSKERNLELPSIGWQLFILDSSQSDPITLPAFLDTYATRLLTEPLRAREEERSSKLLGPAPTRVWRRSVASSQTGPPRSMTRRSCLPLCGRRRCPRIAPPCHSERCPYSLPGGWRGSSSE